MFDEIGIRHVVLVAALIITLYRIRAALHGSGLRAWHTRHTSPTTGARWSRVLMLELTEVVLAGVFLAVGGAKLIGRPDMIALFHDIGVGQWFRYLTGAVEVTGAALLVIPLLSGASAVVLGGVMIIATLIEMFVLHRPPVAALACLSGHTFVAWARISRRHRTWLYAAGDPAPTARHAHVVPTPSRAKALNARWNFSRINDRRRRIRQAATTSLCCATALLPAKLGAQATVRGVLYDDATGLPVRGTVMLVDPSSDAAVVYMATDSVGQFALRASRGLYDIGAVRPGWVSVLSAPVSLENGEELTIRVPIAANGFPRHSIGVLEHVRPKAGGSPPARDRRASALDAFEARRISGTGLHFDRKQLAKASVSTLGEFLQNVSGLDVVDPASATSMQMSRSAGLTNLGARVQGAPTCHVGWFLDGHRIDLPGQSDPYTDSLALMELDALEAIEVFRGLSEMPLEFAEPDLRCGAIALWTRT